MRLDDVLRAVTPVRGMSSVIAAFLGGGDVASVSGEPATLETIREHAEEELKKYGLALEKCQSDYAYWGYLASVEYWRMVIDLLEAAKVTGVDNLPDVPLPASSGIVMDLIAEQREFGRKVLRAAREESHDA